jgi:uncharacterized lipoprotein YmbA
MMNIHQVVENARYLEKTIEEQASTIKKLEAKLESVDYHVYTLLGGIYNQQTQSGTLDLNCDILFSEKQNRYENDTSIWTYWRLLSRQGDSNEERIEKLEQQLNSFWVKVVLVLMINITTMLLLQLITVLPDLIEVFSDA